jgi:tetratricopeptide (TPR) repeat protein
VSDSPPVQQQRLILALLLVVTTLVYLPALYGGFLNLDDPIYVTALRTLSWRSLFGAFARYFEGHYHPLTLISLALNYHWGDGNAFGFHVTNLLFHLANTLLVFAWIRRLTRDTGMALFTCAIFALHPVNVEAVAWITSRKDVQYSFFTLLGLWIYTGSSAVPSLRAMLLTGLFMLFALLSKGMAIMFPLLLLLVDWLRNRPLINRRVWIEKLPLLLLSLVFAGLTLKAQQETGYLIASSLREPLLVRIASAGYACLLYAKHLIVPTGLCAHYPYPDGLGPGAIAATAIAVLAVFCATVALARRSRPAAFALLFTLANVVMMLKIVPVSDFIVADRYLYTGSVGFALSAALGLRYAFRNAANRPYPIRIAGLTYLLLLTALAATQSAVWSNSISVWTRAIEHDPHNAFALNMRGVAWAEIRQLPAALNDYARAVEANPNYPRTYINRGYVYYRTGEYARAEMDFTRSIEISPDSHLPWNNRGLARQKQGRLNEAIADYDEAIRLNPDYITAYLAYHNRGEAHLLQKRYTEALDDLDRSLEIKPDYYPAYCNRALAKLALGRYTEALANAERAIQLDPEDPRAHKIRSAILRDLGPRQGG